MPELNGIQLLSCVKQDANLRAVPVVSEWPPPPPAPLAPPAAPAATAATVCPGAGWAWLPAHAKRCGCGGSSKPAQLTHASPPPLPAVMSSVDQEETVAECVQQGAEEYLVKPVSEPTEQQRGLVDCKPSQAAGPLLRRLYHALFPLGVVQVTKKEVQHIWQHVWRKRCAAAQVPQLPLEAAAAAAAAAGAAALWQQQQAAAAAAPPAEAPAQPQAPHAPQDVQQPASAGGQVQADSVDALVRSAPQAAGAGGLHMRQSVFSAAVSLVQGAHLQRRPLLCLRPSHLLFSQLHGLSVAVPSPQQQGGSGDAAAAAEVDSLYVSPDEAAGHPTCQSDMFSLGLLFVGERVAAQGVWTTVPAWSCCLCCAHAHREPCTKPAACAPLPRCRPLLPLRLPGAALRAAAGGARRGAAAGAARHAQRGQRAGGTGPGAGPAAG